MGLNLTKRDFDILVDLHGARYMTAPQIAALYWRSSKDGTKDPEGARMRACQRRLRQLTDAGLIRRIEQPVLMGEGRKPYLYTLDKGAVGWLEKKRGIDPKTVDWRRKSQEENYPFLEHLLATTDFRIALELACDAHPDVELYDWVDEKELKSDPDRVNIRWETTTRGGEKKVVEEKDVAIVPDAHFVLIKGRKRRHYFVEIDRGTVTVRPTRWERRGWARKVRAYRAYYHTPKYTVEVKGKKRRVSAYQYRYKTPFLRILTVTSGEGRLEYMRKVTAEVGGKDRFWFTTFEQISSEEVLTGEIWLQAVNDAPVALLT